jgi:hypothetical protein
LIGKSSDSKEFGKIKFSTLFQYTIHSEIWMHFFKTIIQNFRKIKLLSCATFKVAFNWEKFIFIDTKILMKQPKLNIDCIECKFL